MTQAHYVKGYFLLHYLLQLCGDREQFLSLLRTYIRTYYGQLVSSTHFIDLFYSTFPQVSVSKAELVQAWLHSPGIPQEMEGLSIINVKRNNLYSEVSDAYREVYHACQEHKNKRRNWELELEKLR